MLNAIHQHCCFGAINTYICNKAERQWDNTSYCIVMPSSNSDQHKGLHQSRSKLTPTLQNGSSADKCGRSLLGVTCRSSWSHWVGAICWACWHFCEWWVLMNGHESAIERRTGGDGTFWTECQDVVACLYACCFSVFVCVHVCTLKDRHRWQCQGWVITVVFSTLQGRSDRCDGWFAVWPPSSRFSLAQCLEIGAERLGC